MKFKTQIDFCNKTFSFSLHLNPCSLLNFLKKVSNCTENVYFSVIVVFDKEIKKSKLCVIYRTFSSFTIFKLN